MSNIISVKSGSEEILILLIMVIKNKFIYLPILILKKSNIHFTHIDNVLAYLTT
jgi:hypothetical protein